MGFGINGGVLLIILLFIVFGIITFVSYGTKNKKLNKVSKILNSILYFIILVYIVMKGINSSSGVKIIHYLLWAIILLIAGIFIFIVLCKIANFKTQRVFGVLSVIFSVILLLVTILLNRGVGSLSTNIHFESAPYDVERIIDRSDSVIEMDKLSSRYTEHVLYLEDSDMYLIAVRTKVSGYDNKIYLFALVNDDLEIEEIFMNAPSGYTTNGNDSSFTVDYFDFYHANDGDDLASVSGATYSSNAIKKLFNVILDEIDYLEYQ